MNYTFKQRFYPTQKQEKLLSEYFGSARFAWNVGLEMISRAYSERGQKLSYIDVGKQFTVLKKTDEFSWMRVAPVDIYAQKLKDLDRAFANFFAKRTRYPRFKKRGHSDSIRFIFDHRHIEKVKAWQNHGIIILPKLGRIKTRDSQHLPENMPKMVTVSKNSTGQYFVSFAVDSQIKYKPLAENIAGIDLGISSLATLSNGEKIDNPKHLDKLDRRLRFQQRHLSRKVKGSNRWQKQRRRVAKLHERIRASRLDYLHKTTTRIIDENQVICVETLNVKGMAKNRRLARSIHDASMGEFLRQLKYKSEWYGRTLVEIDQWFPSSKTCSCCGHKMDEMNLSVREWECPKCGTKHDRDINAAQNILTEGLRILGAGSPDVTCVEIEALADGQMSVCETAVDETRILIRNFRWGRDDFLSISIGKNDD